MSMMYNGGAGLKKASSTLMIGSARVREIDLELHDRPEHRPFEAVMRRHQSEQYEARRRMAKPIYPTRPNVGPPMTYAEMQRMIEAINGARTPVETSSAVSSKKRAQPLIDERPRRRVRVRKSS